MSNQTIRPDGRSSRRVGVARRLAPTLLVSLTLLAAGCGAVDNNALDDDRTTSTTVMPSAVESGVPFDVGDPVDASGAVANFSTTP
nr:hypothetical protein [Acidimicrobiia bacterium]